MRLDLGKYFNTVCTVCGSNGCTMDIENITVIDDAKEDEINLKVTIRCYICMALEEQIITISKKS